MTRVSVARVLVVMMCLGTYASTEADESDATTAHPLVGFERIIGGKWHLEGDRMISELVSCGADGKRTSYVETWEFTDDAQFTWTLFRATVCGLEEEMGGVYTRTD